MAGNLQVFTRTKGPISTVLRAVTGGIVTTYVYGGCRYGYCISLYSTKTNKLCSYGEFPAKVTEHRQSSSGHVVTDSFRQSQIVTPGFSSKYGAYWSDHPLSSG